MSFHRHNRTRAMQGFSLVEIMVAMVIGMLGMLVMLQVFAQFEGQKRTTASGSEAQNNGTLTLDALSRDLQMAGYGISSMKMVGCDLTLPSGLVVKNMGPVTISPNPNVVASGDAQTDTLLIFYGTSSSPAEGDGITVQAGPSTYSVQTPTSFAAGDMVIAVTNVALPQPNPCSLAMTSVVSSGGSAVPFNVNVNVASGVAGVTNGLLFNLGKSPVLHAYAVRNGNLTMCDYMANDCSDKTQTGNQQVWMPVARDVVSLRAQYGRDTTQPNMDGSVDVYHQNTAQTTCDWMRTLSVRFALAIRSGQLEKSAVTTAPPSWDGSPAGGGPVQPPGSSNVPIILNGNASWKQYRYKVYQTTVPLRNVAWAVNTGC